MTNIFSLPSQFLLLAASIMLIATDVSFAADRYLCVAENLVGFSYNKTKTEWIPTKFEANTKYVVKRPEYDDKKIIYIITELGKEMPFCFCESDFTQNGFLDCGCISGEFRFNRKNGRYLRTHALGYFNVLPEINSQTDETSDDIGVEIGKCSSF